MNEVNLIGRLVKDFELKTVGEGESSNVMVMSSIAVDRHYRDKNGEKITDFIPIQAWNVAAETLSKYVKKGDKLGITGRLETYVYEKEGEKKQNYKVLIEKFDFLSDNKKSNNEAGDITKDPDFKPFDERE